MKKMEPFVFGGIAGVWCCEIGETGNRYWIEPAVKPPTSEELDDSWLGFSPIERRLEEELIRIGRTDISAKDIMNGPGYGEPDNTPSVFEVRDV